VRWNSETVKVLVKPVHKFLYSAEYFIPISASPSVC
jgi:hypothetical protein